MTAYKVGDRVRSTGGLCDGQLGTVVKVFNVKANNGGHYRVLFDGGALATGARNTFKLGIFMKHLTEPKKKEKKEFGVFFWRTTMPRPKQHFNYNAVYKQIRGKMALAGYVRCELVQAVDLSEALSMGKPRKGEALMNSHEILK